MKNLLLGALALLLACATAHAQSSVPTPLALKQGVNIDGSGVMLHGYDPVSYFQGKPRLGSEIYAAVTKDNAQYYFVSKENLRLFLKNPAKYSPRFGGFCAYGVGHEYPHLSDVNAENACMVRAGELLCFLNAGIMKRFLIEHPPRILARANHAWPALRAHPKTWDDVKELALGGGQ